MDSFVRTVRPAMYLTRGLLAWLAIMLAESLHGTLRQVLLAPAVGDFAARRISFFTGMGLIFLITCLLVRWIAIPSRQASLEVGAMWAVLTLAFEFGVGFFVLRYTSERVFEDYDISRGGLMGFGIAFMLVAPYLAARLRGFRFNS
jgi:hypothetical protein